jgi:hypothetical protein
MTTPDYTELRALLKRASGTTGPWFVGRLESYRADTGSPFRCIYRGDGESAFTRIVVGGGEGEDGAEFDCDADAALIVAAVNALPTLLSDIEALRQRVAELEAGIKAEREACAQIAMQEGMVADTQMNAGAVGAAKAAKNIYAAIRALPLERSDA